MQIFNKSSKVGENVQYFLIFHILFTTAMQSNVVPQY
jgi:hypothetical protein